MVFAFGSPNGLRNSLTHGLVSAVARQVDPDSPQIFVQTDAPINPGNSGGPLVNIRGEVVGVNTFIMSQSGGNEGLGFAIPSATAQNGVSPAPAIRSPAPAGSGHEHPDHHAGHGGGARTVERLRRHRVRRLARRSGRGGRSGRRRHPGVGGWPARREPADGQLQLPPQGLSRTTSNWSCSGERRRSASASSRSKQRSEFDSVSSMADPDEEPGGRARHHRRRDRCHASPPRPPGSGIRTASSSSRARPARPATCRCMPRDIIRSVNNRRVATLDALRESVRVAHAGHTRDDADSA